MRHGYRVPRRSYPQSYIDHCSDRFGFMFPGLARRRAIPYNSNNRALLEDLGQEMGTKPNSGATSIPAGYTYLGQFIDHDITLDPFSDIDRSHTPRDVEDLLNFRTPSLDLDSVYGNGPSVDPHLYLQNTNDPQEDGVKLLIGSNLVPNNGPGGPPGPGGVHIVRTDFDIPRTSALAAIIGDPRNDENLFVSQIHHAFLKFHNSVVDHLKGTVPDQDLFNEAWTLVKAHYQWIVLHDFLPKIALQTEINKSTARQRFFRRRNFYMPVEFSVAAYRFGHSLVREEYDFNDNFNSTNGNNDFMKAFEFIRVPHLPVRTNWVVDLNRFFDTGTGQNLNIARSFDTSLAPALNSLPGNPAGSFMAHLAKRNLVRSIALSLPTGQAIAKRLRATPLTESELLQNATSNEDAVLRRRGKFLLKNTPLWYYILKEAEVRQSGSSLGQVGSIIVAETFLRILREDSSSIINTSFGPSLPRIAGKPAGNFDMSDLLNFAGVLS